MVTVSGEKLGFISFNPTELNYARSLGLRFNSGNFIASQAAMFFSMTSDTQVLKLLPRTSATIAARACNSGASRNLNWPEYGLLGAFPSFLQVAK
jgi:hypothetical protein